MKSSVLPGMVLLALAFLALGCPPEETLMPTSSHDQVAIEAPGRDVSSDILPDAQGRHGPPKTIPPNAKPHGKSYSDWSIGFWQWLWAAPTPENPGLDDSGEFVANNQQDHVWYLAASYWGDYERTATIPPGTMLFINVMSWFGSPAIGDPEDEEELRAVLAWYMENSSNVILEVDGVAVENIWDYRIITDELFGFWVPEQNVPNDVFGVELPEGYYYPAAGDGIFVMLAPLSAGEHTIHIHGEFPENTGYSDVIYSLTVGHE